MKKAPPITKQELLKNTTEEHPPAHLSTPCRVWKGKPTPSGYAQISRMVNGKQIVRLVHRVMFECVNGLIPDGLNICHKCDVRNCIADDHLFSGTDLDNVRDCIAKGRNCPMPHYRGEKNPLSKLDDCEVEWIKRILKTKKMTQMRIAEMFAINQAQISRINSGVRVVGQASPVPSCSA